MALPIGTGTDEVGCCSQGKQGQAKKFQMSKKNQGHSGKLKKQDLSENR